MDTKKILVIGGGPAGLTAAYELVKKGYIVTVLEASPYIGGISRTVQFNGYRMDIGGHRFFSKDKWVNEWWNELLPVQGSLSYDDLKLGRQGKTVEGGPDPEKEDEVMLYRTRISRIYYGGHFYDYPVSLKWETLKNMGFITTMKVGFSFLGASIKKRKENSLEDYYINCFGRKLYSMFFEGYTEKLWGRHPSEIDASWGRQRTKGLSLFGILGDMFSKIFSSSKKKKKVQTSLIEEFQYPKYGPGQLWELVARKINEAPNGEVLMNTSVKRIERKNGAIVALHVDTPSGEERIEADYVFSSMPLKDLSEAMDQFPESELKIARELPYRDFVTVGLLVDKLELKNQTDRKTLGDIVPDCWIYVQDTGVKLGRIQIFNNWSPYLLKDPDKHVWVGLEYFCKEGDDFWNMSEEECTSLAISELIKLGIIRSKDAVSMSHRERVKKAYPAYFDSYSRIDELIAYLNTIGNLFCIGRNGQHRYNNMDHSMVTALEAVKAFESGTSDRKAIWSVNTEESYHEEKLAEDNPQS